MDRGTLISIAVTILLWWVSKDQVAGWVRRWVRRLRANNAAITVPSASSLGRTGRPRIEVSDHIGVSNATRVRIV